MENDSKGSELPERIWMRSYANELGCYVSEIQGAGAYVDAVEYVRADLATPSTGDEGTYHAALERIDHEVRDNDLPLVDDFDPTQARENLVEANRICDEVAQIVEHTMAHESATPSVQVEGWQPISTAPTDREVLLAFRPNWPIRTGSAEDVPFAKWAMPPTHWMPLPAPPKEK
jgi:hypothetical protein